MTEVYERVLVGDGYSCQRGSEGIVVVHACKFPCHRNAVGYRSRLPQDHPNYLVKKEDFDLYLNMIDPDLPYFKPPLFTEFLNFAGTHWDNQRKVLIHCNQGLSRSPTLALILLSKHFGEITNESYQKAKKEFIKLYPDYQPGLGIQTYLNGNWDQI